jgi:hypothetical protein
LVGFDVLQQQINLIRRFFSNALTPDSLITRWGGWRPHGLINLAWRASPFNRFAPLSRLFANTLQFRVDARIRLWHGVDPCSIAPRFTAWFG